MNPRGVFTNQLSWKSLGRRLSEIDFALNNSPFFLPRVGNKMVKLTPVGMKGKHNTGEKLYTCDHCEKSFST